MKPGVGRLHQLVYHAGEGRAYLIGGSTRKGDGYRYFRDAWRWEGDRWMPRSDLPFPRSSHQTAYHAGRGELLLFGGGFRSAVGAEGVVWARSADGWRAVDGRSAAGRDEPGMCYDPERGAVVLFGGWGPDGDYRGETWTWSGDELMLADTLGPAPRAGHLLVLDPVRRRCLLNGGRGEDGYLDDTWSWAGRGWERIDLRGTSPEPRSMARLAFTEHGIILFGGRTSPSERFHDHGDTWILRGDRWEEVGRGR